MKLETKTFAFEVKASSDDGSTFEGLGAAFNNLDGGRDIIAPTAYDKHLDQFRAEGKIRDEHQVTTGKVTDAKTMPGGLYVNGRISDTLAGRDQRTLLKDGVITRLSVGHLVLGKQYLETPEEVKSYWSTAGYTPTEQDLVRSANGVRLITEARPIEISTTFLPMNDKCAITGVKSDGLPAGLTFDAHSDHTLAVLEEFTGRARRLIETRGAEGRTLSRKRLAEFRRLGDTLARLLEAIETKSDPGADANADAESPAQHGKPDAARVYAEFLAIDSRLRGVAI